MLEVPGGVLVWYSCEELLWVAVQSQDQSALGVLTLLQRLSSIFTAYFGSNSVSKLRRHYVTAVSVLEEALEYGAPLLTHDNALVGLVPPPSLTRRVSQFLTGKGSVRDSLASTATSAIAWRRDDVKYLQNEVYFDVMERVDAVIERNGVASRHTVHGEVWVNSKLSGMPELTANANDFSIIQDAALHPCVRIGRFTSAREIAFLPPDGKTCLLRYVVPQKTLSVPVYLSHTIDWRANQARVRLCFGTKPMMAHGGAKGSYAHTSVMSSGGISSDAFAASGNVSASSPGAVTTVAVESVRVEISIPSEIVTVDLTPSHGKLEVDVGKRSIVWEIGNVGPEKGTPTLTGSWSVAVGQTQPLARPVARLHWLVPNTTSSGFSLRNVKLHKEDYSMTKGARYVMRAGRYEVRM